MRAPFSVVMPTIARPTLIDSLRSCDDPLVLEILVSPDGRQAHEAAADLILEANISRRKAHLLNAVDESRLNQLGHPQRNRACLAAAGKWLLFMDDDDVFVPGAFARILLGLESYRPHLFRMRVHEGNEAGKTLWEDQELRECNVGSPMFVVPNKAVGWWPPRPAGDYAFMHETCRLQGPPVFVDEVIAEIRPGAHDRMPV